MRHLRESAYLRRRVAWLDAQFKDVPTLMASLKSSGQTVPYVADGVAIEPAADGARRIVSAAVRSAVQVDVFVNGRLLGWYQGADGSIGEVPVSRGMLAHEGRFNCVAWSPFSTECGCAVHPTTWIELMWKPEGESYVWVRVPDLPKGWRKL